MPVNSNVYLCSLVRFCVEILAKSEDFKYS